MKTLAFAAAILALLVVAGPVGAAARAPVVTAKLGKPPDSNDYAPCSLGCAIGWETTASSHLPPQGRNRYDAKRIDDGLVNTAWVEGRPGHGIGETVTYTFTPALFGEREKINFSGFYVINGYCKNPKTWRENSRVKRVLISYNNQPLCEAILHDSMNVQFIHLKTVWLRPGDIVTVTILAVYPGDKYQDTAISEMVPLGAH